MKIFLSWSGNQSHLLAQAFKDWLPSVFQSVKPFLSSKDINAGVQWFPKLKEELEAADFGIVCLTRSNLAAQYIMLESGALAMRVDAAKLVPVLCDVSETELGKNPLTAFNYVHLTKEGVSKLAESVNLSLGENGLPKDQLEKTFDKWWPDLEEKIKAIIEKPDPEAPKKKEFDLESSIEEILAAVRSLVRRVPFSSTLAIKYLDEADTQTSLGHLIKDLERSNLHNKQQLKQFFEEVLKGVPKSGPKPDTSDK